MSKEDDVDDDFLPPPPSDDAPSGAPNFGGWELLALLALRDGDPKLMKKSIEVICLLWIKEFKQYPTKASLYWWFLAAKSARI